MDLGLREAQQRRHPTKVRTSNVVFDLIFTSLSGQTGIDTAKANNPFKSQ